MAAAGLRNLLGRMRGQLDRWRTSQEKRQAAAGRRPPRVPLTTRVEISGHHKRLTGASENIAAGGMLLHPDGQLSVGEPVNVEFQLPDGPRIDIPAVVCRKQPSAVALRFDVMDDQRLLIEKWVRDHAVRNAS